MVKNISKINWVALVISVVAITILILVKTYVNDKYKKKLKIPIPIELIVVRQTIKSLIFIHL